MKKQILSIALIGFLASSLILTGCKKDEEAPVITPKGGNTQTVVLNASLTDPGATADDNEDGDLTSSITSDYLTVVKKDLAGTYTVTYKCSDEAGNEGTATLSVTVKNDASAWAGDYAVTDVVGGATYNYSQTVTASATVNNRITFNKFGNYANNTGIYANITGTNVDLPSQTAIAVGSGSAIFDRTFSGTGSKNSAGFVLNYTETGNGASASGIMTFVK
jgi:hypothetical protein